MIDFMGKRKIFFILSTIIMLSAVVFTFFPGVKLDIQFKGGTIINYSYTGTINKEKVAQVAEKALGQEVNVQDTVDVKTKTKNIVISLAKANGISIDKKAVLTQALTSSFAANKIVVGTSNSVDATTGKEFLYKCLVAVLLASVLMTIYVAIRFRKIGGWSAGVMAVIALIHDVVVVYATFVVFGIPINDSFMAVVLTILGYSLNDTIVIYDRIRENERNLGKKFGFSELVNKSINQSFVRSINTSVATIMALTVVSIVAIVYNVNSIVSFAFPMTIGMISGVYSTIWIAGPLWVVWQEYKDKKQKNGIVYKSKAKA